MFIVISQLYQALKMWLLKLTIIFKIIIYQRVKCFKSKVNFILTELKKKTRFVYNLYFSLRENKDYVGF